MATQLNNPVNRVTSGKRHEKGKTRLIVISLLPPALIGFRLQGTRQTYWIDAEVGYEIAVRRFLVEVEKEAKKIKKVEGGRLAGARAKARKRLLK